MFTSLTPQEPISIPWRVTDASFSPDYKLLAVVGLTDERTPFVCLLDTAAKTRSPATTGPNVEYGRYRVSFSHDGQRLAIFDHVDSYLPTLVSFTSIPRQVIP